MDHSWSSLIVLHAFAASFAMVFGAVNVLRRKRGDRPHRTIGRIWLVLMYFTAVSSFWIQQLRPGNFSWIHGLSAFTIVTLSLGLWNARRGNVRAHAGNMIGTYAGLWGAFIGVTVVPSRLVPQAFQANWLGMSVLTLGIVAVGLGAVAVLIRLLAQAGVPGRPLPSAPGPAR